MRSKKLWGTFSADFAAHTLTYLGVLLSIVVIYVFFAFGYFGQAIDDSHKELRPVVEVGVVLFFFGLAWLLRHRSGIPQTSTAIELIGVILVPIMLSASFRDGCTTSYRPWCVPDLEGPSRWAGYAAAGLITTAIYYVLARRRAIYGYLVGTMLWVSLGAFALYLEDGLSLLRNGVTPRLDAFSADGISAPQLITVLAGIGLTLGVASRFRNTSMGRVLSVPTVRAGVLFTPFVLTLSLVFSYNDALSRGVVEPDLADLAWPNVFATSIAAVVFAIASNARFAWESLGRRVRRDTALVLHVAAYLSLAASWLLTAGFGVSPAWLGAGLIGYAIAVAFIDHFVAGPRIAAVWIVRTALAIGAALALLEPGATVAAWGTIGGLAVIRSAMPAVAENVARFVPNPEPGPQRLLALWAPLLVMVGAGAARLGWPDTTPFVLVGAGVVFVSSRLLPKGFADLRSFASVPVVLAGAGALGIEIWRQYDGAGFAPYELSAFLLALALLAGVADIPAPARGAAVTGLTGAAAMLALREYFGTGAWETAWIDTSVLATAGGALLAVSLLRSGDRLLSGMAGHALVIAAAVRSLWFEETAILGLGVLAIAHIVEAITIEVNRDSVFSRLARVAGPAGEVVRSLPTLVAAVTLAPLTILVGWHVPLIAVERARFGPVLAALSLIYLIGAIQRLDRARRISTLFAFAAALGSVAVSAPSTMALLVTTMSAAVVTAVLSFRARRPYVTLVSWMLVVAWSLLAAYRGGITGADLYLVLHVLAVLLVLVPAVLTLFRRNDPTHELGDSSPKSGLRSAWSVPPVYLGMVLLPAALALAIANGGWIAWLGVSTAVAYGALGVATRAGGVVIPMAASCAIAYASVLYDNQWAHPFQQPLVWLPLAAVFVAFSAVLPGKSSWRLLDDPAPGLVVSGLGVAALAMIYSRPAGVLDLALVGCALLLAAIYIIRREAPWLGVSGVALVAAGLVSGGYWAPAATLTASLVTGLFADGNRSKAIAVPLRAVTTLGAAATFALTGVWLDWSASELAAIAAISAGTVVAAAVVFTVATSWTQRARVWALPLHVLGHGLVVASYLAGATDLSGGTPFALATVLALLEAGAIGVIGTLLRRHTAVAGSISFLAAGYALFAIWQEWDAVEVIVFTAAAGIVLTTLAAVGLVTRELPVRVRLWMLPVLVAGQVAGLAVIGTAVSQRTPRRRRG